MMYYALMLVVVLLMLWYSGTLGWNRDTAVALGLVLLGGMAMEYMDPGHFKDVPGYDLVQPHYSNDDYEREAVVVDETREPKGVPTPFEQANKLKDE